MHTLVTGLDGTNILEDLTDLGLRVIACGGTHDATFSATLKEAHILIVRDGQVTRRMIEDAATRN